MLEDSLSELGWSRGELARRLDVKAFTVSRWGDDPPVYVLAYLELALSLHRLRGEAEVALLERER